MPDNDDPFQAILGSRRGAGERRRPRPSDRDPSTPAVPADILDALRAGEVSSELIWDYASAFADAIDHNPNGQRRLNNRGESFIHYPAGAPCQFVVEPDDPEQRDRLGSSVTGTLEALIWDLASPQDPDPSDEALHENWEVPLGRWQLCETPVLSIWQPAKAPCSLEVRTASGEHVIGVLQALQLPVDPDLVARI
jgi:hypothetical protein